MLKMFLCESHIIFLSKLREHHVANAVYKVTSDCEVKLLFPLLVLFSMPSCSRSKHCSTMSLLLVFQVSWMRDIWLSLARNKRVSSEIIKTIKIFFFNPQNFLLEIFQDGLHASGSSSSNSCSISRGVAQVREANEWVNINVYFHIPSLFNHCAV